MVELRFSTKRLEAQVEDMEIRHDQVKRRVRKYQNDLREIEDENASVGYTYTHKAYENVKIFKHYFSILADQRYHQIL